MWLSEVSRHWSFVGSGVYFFDRFKNQDILGGLFDKAHVYFAFYFSFFMVTIAAELTLVTNSRHDFGQLGSLLLWENWLLS